MDQNAEYSATKRRHVVAMPYPGRGHINPMLNLCKLINSKSNDFLFTFVVTEEWLGFLSSEPKPPADIRLTPLPQVIPSEIGRSADFPGFIEAVMTKLQDPLERLLDRLEPRPTAFIYDLGLVWAVAVANQRNIPAAAFVTNSASVFSIFSNFELLVQHGHFPLDVSERGDEIVDYIPGLPSTTIADLPTFFHGSGRKTLHRMLEFVSAVNNAQYILSTSIYEFEKQVIDCLKTKFSMPLYSIGPMIPYFNHTNELVGDTSSQDYYFKWLDSQPRGSVLYISQGSFLSASNDQTQEIVEGIKESGVRFFWVTRGDTSWFKDESGILGVLVPWCDQFRVLCHPSIGGFWTHCGWNSVSEGIYAGVPMLTYPLFWDQIPNSKFVVNDLKIGWRVINNDAGKLVTRQEIAQLVRSFMDPENGKRKEMVKRASELQDTFREAIADGGSAASELDVFISRIG